MENQQMNRLAAAYRADLLYAVERAKQGNCAPCWQDYCMEELAAAKDTGAYPQDGDALRAELQRLTAVVPQITNREAEAAELAAYGGKLLFYLDCDRGTLVELAYLPAPGRYSACAYIDAQASRADRPAYARSRPPAPPAPSPAPPTPPPPAPPPPPPPPRNHHHSLPAHPADSGSGEFDTVEEALGYLYTCLHCPDSILC